MRKINNYVLGMLLVGIPGVVSAASDADTAGRAAVACHTSMIEEGAGNVFSIRLGLKEEAVVEIDGGFGRKEIVVGPAVYNPSSQTIDATTVSTEVSEQGLVTVYADPELVDYLDAEGQYITSIDMTAFKNLEILNLDHNRLESLDLTSFSKLQSISLTDNEFNVSPLVVGPDKPDLAILTLDIIENMSADFNISDYPALQVFSAWSNKGLHSLDLSGCPELLRLSIDATDVESLDLSKTPKLRILNISDTRVTDFDLSVLPDLRELYCQHHSGTVNPDIRLKKLDVSHNPKLAYLYCSGNEISELDLTGNPDLMMLNVCHNELTGLDLSENPELVEVNISFNNMTYSTMPLNPGTWSDFVTQQNPMPVDYSYQEGAVIDFTDRVVIPEAETFAALLLPSLTDPNDVTELGEEYFAYDNGVVTLRKATEGKVRVEFYNPEFPDASLATTEFVVKSAEEFGHPVDAAIWSGDYSADKEVSLRVGVAGASEQRPAKVTVDFGDGQLKEFSITSENLPAEANVSGVAAGSGQMSLSVCDGVDVTAFGMTHPLYSFNSSNLAELRDLDLSGCGLYSVDLSMNSKLERLDLSDNNLYAISLDGPYAGMNKLRLNDINLSGNNLTEFSVADNRTLVNLDLSRNSIESLSFRDADFVKNLNVSHNRLTSLDIHGCLEIGTLDASYNLISEIIMPETHELERIDLSGNRLTLASLPVPSLFDASAVYLYGEQHEILIPTKGPGVNLSSQAMVGDTPSVFTWINAEGGVCAEGTQVTVDGGRTRFVDENLGLVSCEITNAVFPSLTLRTSKIETAPAPQVLVASFTTPVGGETAELSFAAVSGAPALYIDWAGNGNLEQYMLKDTYTRFEAVTVKGAEVKAYTYGGDDRLSVFSISGVTMSDFDGSRLNDLVCLSLNGTGLSEITLPENPGLRELSLTDGNFSSLDLSGYPALTVLDLHGNQFDEFDLSKFRQLQFASLGSNGLADVTLDNPILWGLSLEDNNLTCVDLSNVPSLEQLSLTANMLDEIDLSSASSLRALMLDQNRFDFSTLPARQSQWVVYGYRNQDELNAKPDASGRVDLSFNARSKAGGETVYRWFVGEPWFDEAGELTGDELDEDSFTVEEGVTTFLKSGSDLVCVMTNPSFEGLYMYNAPIDVEVSGVDTVSDGSDLTVRSGKGFMEVRSATAPHAVLYRADGTVAGSRALTGGVARFEVTPGIYFLSTRFGTRKILVP